MVLMSPHDGKDQTISPSLGFFACHLLCFSFGVDGCYALALELLICHSNLGTKHKSHQRLITTSHQNGVIELQNE